MSRPLGLAFFLQAVTSLASGAWLFNPFVDPGDIRNTMLNLANHAAFVRAGIVGDILTALGIIFLAATLFAAVGRQNKAMALVALGLYIFEAGILVVSKFAVFVLLNISQEYAAAGASTWEALGSLALETADFIYRVHIIPFGLGAAIFYYLLYKSRIVPKWLSLWGLTTVPFVLIGALWITSGFYIPPVFLALSVLYVPFEFVAGIYIFCQRRS